MLIVKLAEFFCWIFFVDSISNLDPSPQEVPFLMQDEHGNAMEKNEWVHESSKGCCKVNACITSYATKWLSHKQLDQTHGLQMQLGKFGCPSTHPKGLK